MTSIIDTIKAQRNGYLDSPGLPPDWKHGWHSAIDHVAWTVEQQQTNVQVDGVEFTVPQEVAEHIAKIEAALLAQPSPAAAWQEGRESVAADLAKPLPHSMIRESSPNPYL